MNIITKIVQHLYNHPEKIVYDEPFMRVSTAAAIVTEEIENFSSVLLNTINNWMIIEPGNLCEHEINKTISDIRVLITLTCKNSK